MSVARKSNLWRNAGEAYVQPAVDEYGMLMMVRSSENDKYQGKNTTGLNAKTPSSKGKFMEIAHACPAWFEVVKAKVACVVQY